jgi:hypothetical protein
MRIFVWLLNEQIAPVGERIVGEWRIAVGVLSALGESVNDLGADLAMARCWGWIRNMSDT